MKRGTRAGYMHKGAKETFMELTVKAKVEDIAKKPVEKPKETVEEFLKNGGTIKKYAYKWPPGWKKTFNGFSKFDKR